MSGGAGADVLVLLYHAVTPARPGPLDVPVERFRAQLALLAGRGYRGATVSQALGGRAHGRVLAVTFDDAHATVLDHALPALRELGFPGTVFAPVAYADGGLGMSWAQLRLLADAGWEVGSHAVTHRPLTALADAELDAELRGSRSRLEAELGRPCVALAYPFGLVDERVRRAAAAAGYRFGCTARPGLRSGDPLLWPRVGVGPGDGPLAFRLKVARPVRRLRGAVPARRYSLRPR